VSPNPYGDQRLINVWTWSCRWSFRCSSWRRGWPDRHRGSAV